MLLGTLAKPYGTRGMLLVKLGRIKADEIKDRGLVFVEIDGLPVPFFVTEFAEKTTDSIVVRLDGVDDEGRARELFGCSVYVMKDQVKSRRKESDLPPPVNGYRVVDVRLGFVGVAGEIIEMAQNPLLTVMKDDREYLIPVHEDIILEINDKAREIRVDTPEGLFDL